MASIDSEKYAKVIWCKACQRYVSPAHACPSALPPPEGVPLEDLRIP